jgi:1-deoxy-D-xylulose-5-phosphate synthase
MKLLQKIDSPEDLRKCPESELPQLAAELREFIIDVISVKEGHLGASLGVIELTLALHYVFNTPEDRLIWDVGHQAYGHKILTGRKQRFHTNRQKDGLSGFPSRSESPYDAFGTGHSSTSISALLGMAIAARLQGYSDRQHIAVIGDASIASGMAFEALNHAGVSDTDILVILNDNAIGIDPSVGALKKYLTNVKTGTAKEENLFECLNFKYEGPVDGHDLPLLVQKLRELKDIKGPKLLHLITTKGKGLKKAEEEQVVYHAPGRFDKLSGDLIQKEKDPASGPKFQDVFGLTLRTLATQNEKIVGITPAMPTGSSLKYFMEAFPDRAFDVGIAEQHSVTLAAGLASEGMVPYLAIYSTFLQRGYDQLIHDVALQNLPVIFCLDRAGLVGRDGATHHGVFDIAYLSCIPNMTLMSPMDAKTLRNMLFSVQNRKQGPVAIRYPRGYSGDPEWEQPFQEVPWGKARELKKGSKIAVLSTGTPGKIIADLIPETRDPDAISHYDFPFIKPLDEEAMETILSNHRILLTAEDGVLRGGFGSLVAAFMAKKDVHRKLYCIGVPDTFIAHGSTEELQKEIGTDPEALLRLLNNLLNAD